jgi:putative ABC transport system permease protein
VNYGVFISPATADALSLEYSPGNVVADMRQPPTQDQTDALNAALSSLPGNGQGGLYASIETGPPQYATVLAWALLGLSALISIAASAVAIGLARFDGRQDDATLAALGASPRVRRSFAFWQALIIAGFGAVVGTVIGLVPALALSANPHMPFVPPWLQIGITVIGLPGVIAVGSWLLTRKAKVSARRMSMA